MNKLSIKHIPSNPSLSGLCRLIPDVIYSEAQGKCLHMDLLVPWTAERPGFDKRCPLIVFIQGSSWTTPDRGYEIPQLSFFARQGFVVATVEHRSIFEGAAFPAFLKDVKCAIRFLRKNADKYAIDPEQVAVWGTSSGSNAAMLVGLTGGDERFITEEYSELSDTVQAVVGCFGPADIRDLVWNARHSAAIAPVLTAAFGADERGWESAMADFSPMSYVEKGKAIPPFLLLHGNSDVEVPYEQSIRFAQKLVDCGAEVSTVCVDGAGHEWDFWSQAVYEEILGFLKQNLSTRHEKNGVHR